MSGLARDIGGGGLLVRLNPNPNPKWSSFLLTSRVSLLERQIEACSYLRERVDGDERGHGDVSLCVYFYICICI